MTTSELHKNELPTLLSIRDFSKKHPFMSENSIRWLIFKDEPGLEDCLLRVSKRIYIDEKKLFDFLASQSSRLRAGGSHHAS